MSENTSAPAAPAPAPAKIVLEPMTVERNDVGILFETAEIKRGEGKGKAYLAPTVTEENLANVIKWIKESTVAAKLAAMLRMLSQGWWGEAEEQATDKETKEVDQVKLREVFAEMAKTFSARGESIPALKAEIEELVNDMTALDITPYLVQHGPEKGAKLFKEAFTKLTDQIKSLQVAIESKKRTPKEDASNGN